MDSVPDHRTEHIVYMYSRHIFHHLAVKSIADFGVIDMVPKVILVDKGGGRTKPMSKRYM